MKQRKRRKKKKNQSRLVQPNLRFFLRSEIHCKNKNSNQALQSKCSESILPHFSLESNIENLSDKIYSAGFFIYEYPPPCSSLFSSTSILKDQIFDWKTNHIFHSQYIALYFVVYYIGLTIKHTNYVCELTIKF